MQLEYVYLNLHKDIKAYGGTWKELRLKVHVYQMDIQDEVHARNRAHHSLIEHYNLIT